MAGRKGKRMEVEASKYSKKALASWVVSERATIARVETERNDYLSNLGGNLRSAGPLRPRAAASGSDFNYQCARFDQIRWGTHFYGHRPSGLWRPCLLAAL